MSTGEPGPVTEAVTGASMPAMVTLALVTTVFGSTPETELNENESGVVTADRVVTTNCAVTPLMSTVAVCTVSKPSLAVSRTCNSSPAVTCCEGAASTMLPLRMSTGEPCPVTVAVTVVSSPLRVTAELVTTWFLSTPVTGSKVKAFGVPTAARVVTTNSPVTPPMVTTAVTGVE